MSYIKRVMQNWRLSRIEEELDILHFQNIPVPPPETGEGGDPTGTQERKNLNRRSRVLEFTDVPLTPVADGKEPLYSSPSSLVQPADIMTSQQQPQHEQHSTKKDGEVAAKVITEKYDSLGKVKTAFVENNVFCQQQPQQAQTAAGGKQESTLMTGLEEVDEITEDDIGQVESFYKSLKTDVICCQGLANLYFGTLKGSATVDSWTLAHSGIPLLLLDTGEGHRKRRLHIILAERGTGFILWRDSIDHLTNYKSPHPNFHTLHLSTDHTKIVGLSFDDAFAAAEFQRTYHDLISDPEDDLLNVSRKKGKKRKELEKKLRSNRRHYKPPKKNDISQPCCFEHVTKLERCDRDRLVTLHSLVSPREGDRDIWHLKQQKNGHTSSQSGQLNSVAS
ncbi:uncharacterized protein LOC106181814 [Lingula anatina]|uniref:Uncharacterized protein LOC106181814 n=1 Tax=Lingula anatina TaxID=7574 RepID=A0A1S3KGJ0_LINAN|nr:uncharacterized protein LOC106181814 [Lingula anatina]XP_013421754.1 uncharacterized protein LOC106181814 [Lingula anatina]XP_013421755.1 uncharacterized protein LOC106181814 [Lingula anatina]XP_013421756.1 uncharacterized protein LOC106181814 [Lingula anatina]XP_013421757.1 uncharacterized protein LOC106181814 [Lingula anatina]XP_013421760.1 uncharacterized protein LOC106181814 [Lingula anatina]XP_013421761.1 uncharacterized protein LOC106181814 [Lingula anatina]XP_013421762.1 uncharacte|eukprot:XP_013421753.1 uncharacterized protein LOC106181814 [Lingula anatina]